MKKGEPTKILFLGTTDTPLSGHVYSSFKNLTGNYDKRIVVLMSNSGLAPSLLGQKKLVHKIFGRLFNLYRWVYALFRYQINVQVDKSNDGLYCYYQNDFTPDISGWILKKCMNFEPDFIFIGWSTRFLSSRTIRSLYKKTHANIILCFVDEQHMTGGCHYPVDCKGFENDCRNCPALKSGKDFSYYQLKNKQNNFKDIPITLIGTPYDCKLAAEKSVLFRGCQSVASIAYPNVTYYSRLESRNRFDISEDAFVVFWACANLHDKRKGIFYALESLRLFVTKKSKVKLLFAGKYQEEDKQLFHGIDTVFAGYLSQEDMFKAYCASDFFLNTTIGDSGPMMVNYSFALGIPVVSFPIGIADCLITHQETGYLAKYKDIDDLVNGFMFISGLSDEERRRMSENCIKQIESKARKGSAIARIVEITQKDNYDN